MRGLNVSFTQRRKILSLVLALMVCLCFSACRQSGHSEQSAKSTSDETAAADTFDTLLSKPDTSSQATPEEIPATSDLTTLAKLNRYLIDCAGKRIDLEEPVKEIAAALEADSLLYDTKELTDCSGIFHRVLNAMKRRCPDYDYPAVEQYRDTRDLARWYHERGDLILVQDALTSADLIKPGAVLLYGQVDSVYRVFTVEKLLSPKIGINHMGVVVKVDTNASGEVMSYELFHGYGRKGITPASITNWHKREPTRANYPPLGNGREQWVAFARLLNPPTKLPTAR